ncbi:WD40 repeat-like protein, partial [Rhizoctonia solani]
MDSSSESPQLAAPPADSAGSPTVNTSADGRKGTRLSQLKNATKTAGYQVKSSLKAMSQSARVLPPLKSALGDMSEFIGILMDVAKDDENLDELFTELQLRTNALETYVVNLSLESSGDTLSLVFKPILDDLQSTKRDKERGTMRASEVVRRARKIESHLRVLHDEVSLRTLDMTAKQQVEMWLSRLSEVSDAAYNSTYATTVQRGDCTSGTRQELQRMLQLWARPEYDRSEDIQQDNLGTARVFLINGMAGTGKTTIAYSLCKWLDANAQLGASFFCSRTSPLCRKIDRIIPTIAYQLGRFSRVYRSALCKAIEEEPDVAMRDVRVQFEKLIVQPMKSTGELLAGTIVTIDALDECEDRDGAETILGLLRTHALDMPIKFLLTSRPEPFVREKMLETDRTLSVISHLHDIEASVVESDIKTYLASELHHISPPLTEAQLCQLAKQSGTLFIYAATIVRYVSPRRVRVDSASRLKNVLAISSKGSQAVLTGTVNKLYKELDALYRTVLDLAFNEALEEEELEIMRAVLETIVCAMEPMSLKTLSDLLELTKDQITYSLDPLYSVLHVPAEDELVSTLHASFPDFLFDQMRAGPKYFCNEARRNKILAQNCFDIMKRQLRFNICKLETSFVADNEVPGIQERVKESICLALLYACKFWGSHLQATQIPTCEDLHDMLYEFMSLRFLFWVEVMNLNKCIGIALSLLRQTRVWLHVGANETSLPSTYIHRQTNNIWPDTWKGLINAQRFLTHFGANACSICTPHIYISALPLCARSNTVYTTFSKRTRGLVEAGNLASSGDEGIGWASFSAQSKIGSIMFSRDGTQVFYRTFLGFIETWSLHGTNSIFRLSEENIVCFAISSDGSTLVAGTSAHTICIYNMDDDRRLDTLDTRSPQLVRSIAISQSVPTYIASGHSDNVIRIWDIRSKEQIGAPLIGHKARIPSLVFSPTCMQLASGSADTTIRIWDVTSGFQASQVLKGHLDAVNSVAFSLDGTRLVSGSSDRTIRMWDVYSGLPLGIFQGHTQGVSSVAFAPDSPKFVSGSLDETIRFWDVNTGKQLGLLLGGHTGGVSSLAYSPDGSYVASSYDKTIRIWDAHASTIISYPIEIPETHSVPLRRSSENEDLGSKNPWDIHINPKFDWNLYEKEQLRRYHYQTLFNTEDHFIARSQWPNDFRSVRSQDGAILVSCGPRLETTIKTNLNQVICVAFSPRCVRIVVGLLGMNKSAELWEVNLPKAGFDKTQDMLYSTNKSAIEQRDINNGRVPHENHTSTKGKLGSKIKAFGPVTLTGDGWVKGVENQLLFWFCPIIHRDILLLRPPNLLFIVGDVAFGTEPLNTRLTLGNEWARCYID